MKLILRLIQTYKFEHVPVKDVVVRETLSVEEVPEELAEIRVVGFVVESQRAAEVQVGGKLRYGDQEDDNVHKQKLSPVHLHL